MNGLALVWILTVAGQTALADTGAGVAVEEQDLPAGIDAGVTSPEQYPILPAETDAGVGSEEQELMPPAEEESVPIPEPAASAADFVAYRHELLAPVLSGETPPEQARSAVQRAFDSMLWEKLRLGSCRVEAGIDGDGVSPLLQDGSGDVYQESAILALDGRLDEARSRAVELSDRGAVCGNAAAALRYSRAELLAAIAFLAGSCDEVLQHYREAKKEQSLLLDIGSDRWALMYALAAGAYTSTGHDEAARELSIRAQEEASVPGRSWDFYYAPDLRELVELRATIRRQRQALGALDVLDP